jgi:hypothetical protein
MNLSAWLEQFRNLHEKARRKLLDEEATKAYHTGRDELARAMLASQRLTVKEGQTPRQALRVARALSVTLDGVRAVTLDFSLGGFSTVLEKAPGANELVGFTLKLPGGGDPVIGRCKLASSVQRHGSYRTSFTFLAMPEGETERVEMALIDAVLEQLERA